MELKSKHGLGLIALTIVILSCNSSSKDHEQLTLKYDSVLIENQKAQSVIKSLGEAVAIIDSIEVGFEDLNFELEGGTDYPSYVDKMAKIADHAKRAEARIAQLESTLGKDASVISNLRRELGLKTQRIKELEDAIESLKEKNTKMFDLVMVQGQTMHNQAMELVLKKQEIALIEAHVEELLKQAEVNEANSFFARAEALEEAANRTKLAPRKKKQSLKRALDFYQQSLDKGNENAKTKVDELTKRLN